MLRRKAPFIFFVYKTADRQILISAKITLALPNLANPKIGAPECLVMAKIPELVKPMMMRKKPIPTIKDCLKVFEKASFIL